MTQKSKFTSQIVFGLDIGTRSIVGTIGYKAKDDFIVVAQKTMEHETRAMMDGQIHDIQKVSETIKTIKEELEQSEQLELREVCIAAAGRVLKTILLTIEYDFQGEKNITEEDLYTVNSKGVEKAYEEFAKEYGSEEKFYCVGYSVVKYYLNHNPINKPVGHKAKAIQVELIATFLPDDVVDGLYKAVEGAGLSVQNLTLEPIAAIQVAIPEMYRMLNIALIDVGAGTSDISITKDGSIVAYGMLPYAGDKITEDIARYCLVDFQTAEKIKISMMSEEEIQYIDIMCLPQIVKRETIYQIIEPTVSTMARETADKIKELNGGKPVSAVFVVGGGGKIYGYTQKVAEELGIQAERVALRGEEVMRNIQFLDSSIKKDSLLVTPIGICLSFYEQSNNFIHVTLNGKRIKLYDNSKLAVVDAAIGAEFPNEGLFPKRGKELNFSINGKNRLQRGYAGESAIILVNGKTADIHTPIHSNDVISIVESTAGEEAKLEIQQLPEFGDNLKVYVNDQLILLPKFAMVNGELQSGYYEIKEGDQIEILNYYTLKQVADFMDLVLESHVSLYVNNKRADLNEKVYENFSIHLKEESFEEKLVEDNSTQNEHVQVDMNLDSQEKEIVQADGETEISVIVNHRPVFLTGKPYYIFVDIFDYYDFDLSKSQGKAIVTMLNGRSAEYMETLKSGDQIDIYWKES